MQRQPETTLEHLPDETLLLLLSFATAKDALLMSQVSGRFNALVADNSLWPIYYRRQFQEDLPLSSDPARLLFFRRQEQRSALQKDFSISYRHLLRLVQNGDVAGFQNLVNNTKNKIRRNKENYAERFLGVGLPVLMKKIRTQMNKDPDTSVIGSILKWQNLSLRQELFNCLYQLISFYYIKNDKGDLNKTRQDLGGITVLHWAVLTHQTAAVKCLVQLGCDPFLPAKNGDNLLHSATRAGANLELITYLVEECKLNATHVNESSQPPIYLAIMYHGNHLIPYLLRFVNDTKYLFHISMLYKNTFVAGELLEQFGKNNAMMLLNQRYEIKDRRCEIEAYNVNATLPGWAIIIDGNEEFVKKILEFAKKENVSVADLIQQRVLVMGPSQQLQERLTNVNHPGGLELDLLQVAEKLNKPDIVKLILEYSAPKDSSSDVNAPAAPGNRI